MPSQPDYELMGDDDYDFDGNAVQIGHFNRTVTRVRKMGYESSKALKMGFEGTTEKMR